MFKKFFKEWFSLKEKIHNSKHTPPMFKEGEIWWCHLGENIDVEINGKGNSFTRPAIILKKYNKYSFFALPLTTQNKIGTWYCSFIHKNRFQNTSLVQGRSLSHKRLKERVGEMNTVDYQRVNEAFLNLHKKIDPRPCGRGRGECQKMYPLKDTLLV